MTSSVAGVEPVAPRFVYRDDACAHVRLVEGRCFISQSEIILSKPTFDQLKVKVGDPLNVDWATFDAEGQEWIGSGKPTVMSVVGAYEPIDATEQYWADFGYFDDRPSARGVTALILAGRLTLESIERLTERQALDVVIDHAAITGDSLVAVNGAVESGRAQLAGLSGSPTVKADLPHLLARIERDRSLVSQVVPVGAVPLVLLCWFVLFVVVASATGERRQELGLVALRGVTLPRRWWLAAGESIVPILLGAAAGFVLGHYLVRLAAWLLLGTSGDVPLKEGANGWALTALAGAVLAAVLAQRAELAKKTIDLLRNVPGRLSRWGAPVFEVVVVVLAVVAMLQLRQGDSGLTGFAVFGPSLVVIAFGLLAARGVLPLAERNGRRALRRGRIGPTLAAYAMARRPGSQRILALFVVAIALACFAATAASASDDNRDLRIRVELGADRILTVEPVSRTELLGKVRRWTPPATSPWPRRCCRRRGTRGPSGCSASTANASPRSRCGTTRGSPPPRPPPRCGRRSPGQRHPRQQGRDPRHHRRQARRRVPGQVRRGGDPAGRLGRRRGRLRRAAAGTAHVRQEPPDVREQVPPRRAADPAAGGPRLRRRDHAALHGPARRDRHRLQ